MYIYIVYGLIIESDILINELIEASDYENTDVIINHGIVPRHIDNKLCDATNVKFSRTEFYFHIDGVAHYYVAHGNKIIVEIENECNIETVNIFLLGTCFGMLLAQRKTIAMHGGTVVIGDKGIIITGKTGAGKSTLTSAFRKEGYSFLSDDVSALGKDSFDNIIIYPTFPQQKLCKDAIEKMGYTLSNYRIIDVERKKYSISSNNSFLFKEVFLSAIYEINIVEDNDASIEQVFGGEKLRIILKNIYRIETINYESLDPIYFKKCIDISKKIVVFKIYRPKDKFSVGEQMKLVKDSLSLKNLS